MMGYSKEYINKIISGDCLEVMPNIPDKSINLIIADPPYNIGNADGDKIPNYIEWLGKRLLEMQRVLKDNGSFYLFHNDFLQMAELQNWIKKNSKFIFKQLIVWNKRFDNAKLKGYFDGYVAIEQDRNYRLMAEYILFYTLQDDYIDNKLFFVAINNIQNYVKILIYNNGGTVTKANEFYCKWSGKVGNYRSLFFGKTQPVFYTENQYKGLCNYIKSLGYNGYLKTYNELKKLLNRGNYEDLRYTFNNQKSHHSVWNYDIAERVDHITPKPIPLIKNILKHSSNKDDLVLIPFIGSGNDCIACKETGRDYIGIEMDKEYVEIARKRIKAIPQTLFDYTK